MLNFMCVLFLASLYRYEMTHKTLLKSDYRCIIVFRFWLPGREAYVRMRGPNGRFIGYRRLDKRDKDEDNFGPIPGKRPLPLQPDMTGVIAAINVANGEGLVDNYGHDDDEDDNGTGGAAYEEEEEAEDDKKVVMAAHAPAPAPAVAQAPAAEETTTTADAAEEAQEEEEEANAEDEVAPAAEA